MVHLKYGYTNRGQHQRQPYLAVYTHAGMERQGWRGRDGEAGMERQGWRGRDGEAGMERQGWRGRDGLRSKCHHIGVLDIASDCVNSLMYVR